MKSVIIFCPFKWTWVDGYSEAIRIKDVYFRIYEVLINIIFDRQGI